MRLKISETKERNPHAIVYAICDFILTIAIVLISFLSRYSIDIFSLNDTRTFVFTIVFTLSMGLVTVFIFWIAHIYRILTKTYGFSEAIYIAIVEFIVQVFGFIVVLIAQAVFKIDRLSVWSWVLSTIALCGMLPALRLYPRIHRFLKNIKKKTTKTRALIIGAGQCGKNIIDESNNNLYCPFKVVCILDDDTSKIGSSLARVPVVGKVNDVVKFVKEYQIEEVIVAISKYPKASLKNLAALLSDENVRLRIIPEYSEMSGPNDSRSFVVDVNELLYRSEILLDNSTLNGFISNKNVLITGAGGSIGSELVRQIFAAKPKSIILFDIYENSTYEIQQEILRLVKLNHSDTNIVTLIGSTYNYDRLEKIFKKYHPDVVYHAAAYKHVPLMEDSPVEAIRTNVIGTYNVAKLSDLYNVKKMVLVSTDKAVRPTNVMGATKRFAETIIQYFAKISKNTHYAAVRFGNVLGSNGSVIPLFKKQIEAGGPVTITDPQIIRYFMTIPEAVSLILQCSLFADEGEIFVLDMGQPIKIISLAEKLIKQAGYIPYKDIDIVTIGLRPGEKLFEELLIDRERQSKTSHPKIFVEPSQDTYPIEEEIKTISNAFNLDENKDIKELLAKIVNDYTIDKR